MDHRAFRIRARTPARIPKKAYWTTFMDWNSRSTKAMAVMTRKDGRTTPRVAQRAPVKPQTR